jgi:hypothetical protein
MWNGSFDRSYIKMGVSRVLKAITGNSTGKKYLMIFIVNLLESDFAEMPEQIIF